MVNFNKVKMFFFLNVYRLNTMKLFSLFRFCFLFHTGSVTALNKATCADSNISFSLKRQISYENLQGVPKTRQAYYKAERE